MLLNRRQVALGLGAVPLLTRGVRAQRQPGVLRFGLSSFPPSLQPWQSAGTAAATVKLMIFRGLVSYDTKGALRPELAESWERSGETGWTFKLRDNALFHNGEKVTSADVKWTLEQVIDERSTAFLRAELQGIQRIETPDARTVTIVMEQPTATLPQWLANYHMPVIYRDSPRSGPIGAGPFRITAQERGTSIDLVPFDRFYRPGLPKLKGLRIVVYSDENLRVAALQAGDVDLIEYVPWQSFDAIQADPRLKMDATDGPFMYLTFNASKGPFSDARVRRAVAHAVKRDDIVKAAFFGRGSPLEGTPISPASEFYNADLAHGWNYDPARAKALLAEAGVPEGFECALLSTAQYGMHKDTAEVVQASLAAVGIRANLVLPDWATRIAQGTRGQYDMGIMGSAADSNDPDGLSSYINGSLQPSYNRSFGLPTPRIAELLAAGRAEFDFAKRKAIYREMEQAVLDIVPMASLAWRSQAYAMTKAVDGFVNLPGALTYFSGLSLEQTSIGDAT